MFDLTSTKAENCVFALLYTGRLPCVASLRRGGGFMSAEGLSRDNRARSARSWYWIEWSVTGRCFTVFTLFWVGVVWESSDADFFGVWGWLWC